MVQKYVVVHFFTSLPSGFNFLAKEWRPHVTLLQPFALGGSPEEFVGELDKLATATEPFEVKIEGRALFGPNKNIPVALLQPNDAIVNLHSRLIDMSYSVGAVFDTPKFINAGFRPHVTVRGSNGFQDGWTRRVDGLSLVDMQPNGDSSRREVVDTFPLRGLS